MPVEAFIQPIDRDLSHERIEERCGLTAYYALTPQKDTLERTIRAAFGVQHRGQKGAGFLVRGDDSKTVCETGDGLIPEALAESGLKDRPEGNDKWALVHCRYGTSGGWESRNLQPIEVDGFEEPVHVAHNGQFVLDESLESFRESPEESDSLLFTRFLAAAPGKDLEEKIIFALSKVKGAYSLIIGSGDTMYLARDPHGNRPLVYGHTNEGILIGSETTIFNHETEDIQDVTYVERGTIMRIDNDGVTELADLSTLGEPGDCSFETAYFKRPDSQIIQRATGELTTVGKLRIELGGQIATEGEFKKEDYDFAIGMPDSGSLVAAGFAMKSGVTYLPLVTRDHYYPASKRAFMNDEEKHDIKKKVREKIVTLSDKSLWKGKRVVIGDDSIVRGDTSAAVNEILRELGVAHITWVIGYPPVVDTCHLGVSMRTKDELVAVKAHSDSAAIAEAIGADEVHFISDQGFMDVVTGGNTITPDDPKDLFMTNGFCGGCTGGSYPVTEQGVIWRAPNIIHK